MTDYSKQVAQDLLAIGAVKFSPEAPFTWASGIKSPIYTDNRMTIGHIDVRTRIFKGLSELIQSQFPEVEIIGGVATAGIPHAAFVAEELSLPMIYVRSKPKDHGAGQQIEGADVSGKKVVLIDDLISTGGSVLGAVEATRQAGANVLGVVSIFSYELPDADINFANAKLPFYPLTTYSQLIEIAAKDGDLNANQITSLQEWRQDPKSWLQNK